MPNAWRLPPDDGSGATSTRASPSASSSSAAAGLTGIITRPIGATYSCFARSLDMMNAAYHYLALTPLGRHEKGLPYPMDWVRLRDAYKPASSAATCCQT
jgi:predicted dithiol-disulfide oxidoreductase (DUF899 family)